jgi:hypothetical protein
MVHCLEPILLSCAPTEVRIRAAESQLAGLEDGDQERTRLEAKLTRLRLELKEERQQETSERPDPPHIVYAVVITLTVGVPAILLLWVLRVLGRGQRIWRCPVCKSLARLLGPCRICGHRNPGLDSVVRACLIGLGCILLVVGFIWSVSAVGTFSDERVSETEKHSPTGEETAGSDSEGLPQDR